MKISTYNQDKSFKFSILSAQSICNKDEIVHHDMITEKIDALLVTETWLSDRDSDKIWLQATDLNKKELNLFFSDRKERRGGRLGLIIKTSTTQLQLHMVNFIHSNLPNGRQRSHYPNIVRVYRLPSGSNLDF